MNKYLELNKKCSRIVCDSVTLIGIFSVIIIITGWTAETKNVVNLVEQ